MSAPAQVAAGLLAERTGMQLSPGLRERLAACLEGEARAAGLPTERYAAALAADPGAFQRLLDCVTVQESAFFRHPDQFAALEQEVLPSLEGPVTVWSAGCANGEEAWSLAMVLAGAGVADWQVVATDISAAAVARTRAARYATEELAGLPPVHRRWLRQAGELWEVDPALRRRVRVERSNLTARFPVEAGRCQVVFCRNVLIYLERAETEAFLDRLAGWLAPGGLVFLGYSEAVLAPSDRLRVERLGDTYALRAVPRPAPDPEADPPVPRPAGVPEDAAVALARATGRAGAPVAVAAAPPGPASPSPGPEPAPAAAPPDLDTSTMVAFRAGGQDWGVALERVRRVVGAKGLLPLPDPRPGVAGLLHRDGEAVTVVAPLGRTGQLGQVLVLDHRGTTVGLLVDEVTGIRRVEDAVAPRPAGQRSPLVAGVLAGPGPPLLLLDVAALTGWLAP